MKLCSSRNHYTTAPHSFKYSGICFIIFNATIVLPLATHIKTRNGCQRRKCYQEGAESCLSHIHIFRNGISLSNRSFIALIQIFKYITFNNFQIASLSQLVLVIKCLGERFGVNCWSPFLKALRLRE